jgi:hypothetical protein
MTQDVFSGIISTLEDMEVLIQTRLDCEEYENARAIAQEFAEWFEYYSQDDKEELKVVTATINT